MMKLLMTTLIATGLLAAGSACAADMPDVAKKNNCTTCHAIDKKLVGPAWKAVADKYRGDKQASATLFTKISKGGSGVWGSTAMPASSPNVSDADIKALVKFILALK